MSHIIEVKILNNTLLLPCNSNITVTELGNLALLEYERAYNTTTPLTIQYIKDSKNRILSGSIKLIELNLEKVIEIVLNDEINCDSTFRSFTDLYQHYEKVQLSIANQIYQYLNILKNDINNTFDSPSKELLQLLDNLKYTSIESIQDVVINCHKYMETYCNNPLIIKFIIDELQYIFKSSDFPNIAIKALLCLRNSRVSNIHHINIPKLIEDGAVVMKKFPLHKDEIMKIFNDSFFHLNETSSPTTNQAPTNQALIVVESDAVSERGNVKEEVINNSMLPSTKSSKKANYSFAEEENTKNDFSILPSPAPATGMSRNRIEELLQSEDTQCRKFALEKLCRPRTAAPSSLNSPGADRLLPPPVNFIYDIAPTISDRTGMIRSLFVCLSKSLKPPTLGISAPIGDNNTKQYPTAYYVATAVICGIESNPQDDVRSCLKCICSLLYTTDGSDLDKEQGISKNEENVNNIAKIQKLSLSAINEKWKLLLTLIHLQDEFEDISAMSCQIFTLLITNNMLSKYNIRIEKETLLFFINCEIPTSRLMLALLYINYLSKLNMNSSLTESIQYHNNSSSSKDIETISWYIEDILSNNRYAILKCLYRWAIGNYRNDISCVALEALSSFLLLSSVRTFMAKYDAVEKVSE